MFWAEQKQGKKKNLFEKREQRASTYYMAMLPCAILSVKRLEKKNCKVLVLFFDIEMTLVGDILREKQLITNNFSDIHTMVGS